VILSRPNLNGRTPLRVQPEVGEWGPTQVTSARTRTRHRALAPLVFLTVLCGLVALGSFLFWQVQTGPMSPAAAIIVAIGVWVLPALLLLSLVATVLVWILGDPTARQPPQAWAGRAASRPRRHPPCRDPGRLAPPRTGPRGVTPP